MRNILASQPDIMSGEIRLEFETIHNCRYMYCVKPLSDEDALAKTAALIPEFANGVGKKLHQHIVDLDKANPQTNFVSGALDR